MSIVCRFNQDNEYGKSTKSQPCREYSQQQC